MLSAQHSNEPPASSSKPRCAASSYNRKICKYRRVLAHDATADEPMSSGCTRDNRWQHLVRQACSLAAIRAIGRLPSLHIGKVTVHQPQSHTGFIVPAGAQTTSACHCSTAGGITPENMTTYLRACRAGCVHANTHSQPQTCSALPCAQNLQAVLATAAPGATAEALGTTVTPVASCCMTHATNQPAQHRRLLCAATTACIDRARCSLQLCSN